MNESSLAMVYALSQESDRIVLSFSPSEKASFSIDAEGVLTVSIDPRLWGEIRSRTSFEPKLRVGQKVEFYFSEIGGEKIYVWGEVEDIDLESFQVKVWSRWIPFDHIR